MYKIKNFRLNLNKNTVWRQIKSKIEGGFDDRLFDKYFLEFEQALKPASIFGTISKDEGLQQYPKLWGGCSEIWLQEQKNEKPKNLLAMSFAVIYLGGDIAALFADSENDEIKTGISGYMIETASNFISRIIKEDAEKEDCFAEKKIPLLYGSYAEELENVLDIKKIGINLPVDNAALNPAYSGFFCVPWTKKKKK